MGCKHETAAGTAATPVRAAGRCRRGREQQPGPGRCAGPRARDGHRGGATRRLAGAFESLARRASRAGTARPRHRGFGKGRLSTLVLAGRARAGRTGHRVSRCAARALPGRHPAGSHRHAAAARFVVTDSAAACRPCARCAARQRAVVRLRRGRPRTRVRRRTVARHCAESRRSGRSARGPAQHAGHRLRTGAGSAQARGGMAAARRWPVARRQACPARRQT